MSFISKANSLNNYIKSNIDIHFVTKIKKSLNFININLISLNKKEILYYHWFITKKINIFGCLQKSI